MSLSAVSLAKLTVLCADENCYGVDEKEDEGGILHGS